jgi:cytochrome b
MLRAQLQCAEETAMSDERTIRVWDLPTRIFHWSLLVLILVAWFTGEEEGGAALVHRYAGEAIAGLIVFRVLWGFIGGEHSRFADFAAGPAAIAAHVRELFSAQPKRRLGHNPLGGVAVFLLLAVVAAIVFTGLFSGDDGVGGPFVGLWGLELSELHEVLFRVLQGLVIIHLLGVFVESIKARDALVPAMVTGDKTRRADEAGNDAKRASALALVVALSVGTLTSAWLITQPVQAGARSGADFGVESGEHEGRDED